MERIGADEVIKRLDEIIDRAAKGERFIITRGGKDKAEIGPAEEAATRRAEQAAKTIRELRENFQPLAIPVKEAIEDGRAWIAYGSTSGEPATSDLEPNISFRYTTIREVRCTSLELYF